MSDEQQDQAGEPGQSPAHGGYPTPKYEQAPVRRRAESQRLFGHTGAFVPVAVREALRTNGEARKA